MTKMPRPLRWRLGVLLDTDNVSWVGIKLRGGRRDRQGVWYGDPVETAVEQWLLMSEPRPPVEIYTYANSDDFRGSRGHVEGMTLDDHRLMVTRTTAALRGAGAIVYHVMAKA